jgi:BirA family biotin operon repressor/biotin-[acetyl-CoA-carboxylase] ligase
MNQEQLIPGPGVVLWGTGREGLAEPLDPRSLARFRHGWKEDARSFGPWQEVQTPWPNGCTREQWWLSAAPEEAGRRIVVCGPCSSVLDVARPLAGSGALAAFDSVLGVSQWSGRGQLRREWHSPPGNLYAAVVLPQMPKTLDTLAPLLVGYLLAQALEAEGIATSLKWPNDLIAGGAKVGGILVEERRGLVLAGIGLNLVSGPPKDRLRADHAVPAGHLAGLGLSATPLLFWHRLVKFLQRGYADCLHFDTPTTLTTMIEKRLAWLGGAVQVIQGQSPPYLARLVGLAPDGALRVKMLDGTGQENLLVSGSIWPS